MFSWVVSLMMLMLFGEYVVCASIATVLSKAYSEVARNSHPLSLCGRVEVACWGRETPRRRHYSAWLHQRKDWEESEILKFIFIVLKVRWWVEIKTFFKHLYFFGLWMLFKLIPANGTVLTFYLRKTVCKNREKVRGRSSTSVRESTTTSPLE